MPEDLKLSQIDSSQLPPPFRGLHSHGVRKHYQIIFACYFRKSSIVPQSVLRQRQSYLAKGGEGVGIFGASLTRTVGLVLEVV